MLGGERVQKVKKIAKYATNILAIINALLIGILPIWNISGDKVTDTIAVIIAVIGTYLLGDKAVAKKKGE
jgi:hypothetical protein